MNSLTSQIVVRKVFGPQGDNLVGISDVTFDGFPAISVGVETPDGRRGTVQISPIHGDERKAGFLEIEPGCQLRLFCPISQQPLERVLDIDDRFGAGYYRLYRTASLDKGSVILISDVWGHYHSRVIDQFTLVADWARLHEGLQSD